MIEMQFGDGQSSMGNNSKSINARVMVLALCMSSNAGRERSGLVVNASESGSRGQGFEPHSGQTVLCP